MKRILVFIGILWLSVEGVSARKIFREQKTVVSGKVKLSPAASNVIAVAQTGMLYSGWGWGDCLCNAGEQIALIDRETGMFQVVLELAYAQKVVLKYENTLVDLYLTPGDSLFVTFDVMKLEKPETTFQFTGNNAEVAKNLLQWNVFKRSHSSRLDFKQRDLALFLKTLSEDIERERLLLREFLEKYQPDAVFERLADNEIVYLRANHLVAYNYYQQCGMDTLMNTELFPIHIPIDYVDIFYWTHLYMYVQTVYCDFEKADLYSSMCNMVERVKNEEPKGVVRDMMLFYLFQIFYEKDFDLMERVWEKHKRKIHTVYIRNEIKQRVFLKKQKQHIVLNEVCDLTSEERKIVGPVVDSLIALSRGKVVYLDIWSTGCGPCLEELEPLEKLKSRLAENENVVFVGWCMGTSKERWEKIVKKMVGIHVYLTNEQELIFRSKLAYAGIPTYMIIKDGVIVNANAPRPSSPEEVIKALEAAR